MSTRTLARRLRIDSAADLGLSLPEVMIAVVIMFLVMASMGFAMVGALRSIQAPTERNNRSSEIALLGTIFPSDVGSVTPGSTITAGGTGVCGSASNATYTTANTQPLISLPNPTVANPNSSVMYALYHSSAAVTDVAGLSLLRFPCTGTTAGSPLNVITSLQWVRVQSASVPAGSRTVTLALSGGAVSQAIASTTNGSTAVDFAQSSLTAPSVSGTAVDLSQSSATAPSVSGTTVDFSQSSATAPSVSGTAVDFTKSSATGNTTNASTSVSLSQTSSTTTAKGVVSGSPNVTLSASNASIAAGQYVTGTGITAGTTISAVTGTTPVTGLTLSQAATVTGSGTLSFGSAVSGTRSYCASYTGTTCKTDSSGTSAGDVITLFGTGQTAFDGHPCRVTSSATPFTCTLDSAPAAAVSANTGYITATATVCEAQDASVATTFNEPFSGTSYTSNCATAANVNNARVALHINVNAVSSSPAVTLDSAQNYTIYGDVP